MAVYSCFHMHIFHKLTLKILFGSILIHSYMLHTCYMYTCGSASHVHTPCTSHMHTHGHTSHMHTCVSTSHIHVWVHFVHIHMGALHTCTWSYFTHAHGCTLMELLAGAHQSHVFVFTCCTLPQVPWMSVFPTHSIGLPCGQRPRQVRI